MPRTATGTTIATPVENGFFTVALRPPTTPPTLRGTAALGAIRRTSSDAAQPIVRESECSRSGHRPHFSGANPFSPGAPSRAAGWVVNPPGRGSDDGGGSRAADSRSTSASAAHVLPIELCAGPFPRAGRKVWCALTLNVMNRTQSKYPNLTQNRVFSVAARFSRKPQMRACPPNSQRRRSAARGDIFVERPLSAALTCSATFR